MASSQQDQYYLSLLGLADQFRSANPPKVKLCIQCLEAILAFNPPARIDARTRMQLASCLMEFTKNLDQAREHLEQAWQICLVQGAFDDVRLEVASLLADVYLQQNEVQACRQILHKALELSPRGATFWQCRFLYRVAQVDVMERDYMTACQLLSSGAELAKTANVVYTQILFLLSKGMLLIIEKKLSDVHPVLTLAGQLVEEWHGPVARKEGLKVFFLVLQVCHFLMAGQVRSVKPCLKQLQNSIQVITTSQSQDKDNIPLNSAECFQWISKDQMCVLVYLVTVMHSTQAGQLDKAQKYTEKALTQIDKLKVMDPEQPLLWTFQLILLEHLILCRLVVGAKSVAIKEIYQACALCNQQPLLFVTHRAQIHTLLGLYAMSIDSLEPAESQFNTALRVVQDTDLWTFINLNLAIVYLRAGKEQDFYGLLERIKPERLQTASHSLKSGAYYVRGLQAFFQAEYHGAKKYLRETLRLSNDEDMCRLSSCALVLLGHIFLSVNNPKESMNMVQPAMQLAQKIPDLHIQLWASALLKDLYSRSEEKERFEEMAMIHTSSTQMLLKDHFLSHQTPEHALIKWTEGPCPLHSDSTNMPIMPPAPSCPSQPLIKQANPIHHLLQ